MRILDVELGAFLSYPIAVQSINPYFTDKLTIGQKIDSGLSSEEVDVALHEVDTFLGVGRAFLGQHGEQQRIGDSVMDRCILRKHESALAGESKQVESLLKHTVLALHRAIINSEISLIWARLTFLEKKILMYLIIDYFRTCDWCS